MRRELSIALILPRQPEPWACIPGGQAGGTADDADAVSLRAMWELMKPGVGLIIFRVADDNDKGLIMALFYARMYAAWNITANRYSDENGDFWNGHLVISDRLGVLKAPSQDMAGYLDHELCFNVRQAIKRQSLRNLIEKTPLLSKYSGIGSG